MPKLLDLVGHRYGKLTVVARLPKIGSKYLCACKCDCGNDTEVQTGNLRSGHTTSCGKCAGHGEAGTSTGTETHEWLAWKGMKDRCSASNPARKWYFDKGIKVCEAWLDYLTFLADIGRAPTPKHTVDRIDGNKGYEPGNVRWATQKEQHNNKSSNRWFEFRGDRLTMVMMAEKYGMSRNAFYARLKMGWSLEDALTKPLDMRRVKPRKNKKC